MTDALVTTDEGVLDTSLENRQNPTWIADLLQDRNRLIELLTDFAGASPRQELLIKCLAEKTQKGRDVELDVALRRIPMSRLEFYSTVKACRTTKSEFRTGQILDIFRPKVTKAVMEGALPVEHECVKCEGSGVVVKKEKETKCTKCGGAGRYTVQPEHERQITALRISGVLQKEGAGTIVNVNNAVNTELRSSPEFRRDTDKLMYASVVDVAAIPSQSSLQALPENPPAETILLSPGNTGERKTQPDTLSSPNGGSEETPVVLVGKPLGKRQGK